MRAPSLIATALVCCLGGYSVAAERQTEGPPFDLKGVRLGITPHQLNQQFPTLGCKATGNGTCGYGRQDPQQDNVTELNTFAEELVSEWTFEFMNDRLAAVIVTFPAKDFDGVLSGLRAKFGAPSKPPADSRGARFATPVGRWSSGKQVLEAYLNAPDQRTSAVLLAAPEYVQKGRAVGDDKGARRARDL